MSFNDTALEIKKALVWNKSRPERLEEEKRGDRPLDILDLGAADITESLESYKKFISNISMEYVHLFDVSNCNSMIVKGFLKYMNLLSNEDAIKVFIATLYTNSYPYHNDILSTIFLHANYEKSRLFLDEMIKRTKNGNESTLYNMLPYSFMHEDILKEYITIEGKNFINKKTSKPANTPYFNSNSLYRLDYSEDFLTEIISSGFHINIPILEQKNLTQSHIESLVQLILYAKYTLADTAKSRYINFRFSKFSNIVESLIDTFSLPSTDQISDYRSFVRQNIDIESVLNNLKALICNLLEVGSSDRSLAIVKFISELFVSLGSPNGHSVIPEARKMMINVVRDNLSQILSRLFLVEPEHSEFVEELFIQFINGALIDSPEIVQHLIKCRKEFISEEKYNTIFDTVCVAEMVNGIHTLGNNIHLARKKQCKLNLTIDEMKDVIMRFEFNPKYISAKSVFDIYSIYDNDNDIRVYNLTNEFLEFMIGIGTRRSSGDGIFNISDIFNYYTYDYYDANMFKIYDKNFIFENKDNISNPKLLSDIILYNIELFNEEDILELSGYLTTDAINTLYKVCFNDIKSTELKLFLELEHVTPVSLDSECCGC